MAIYFPQQVPKGTPKTMSTVSIRKSSPEGQRLCAAADALGIDPASLLAGICINATRRARRSTPQPEPAAAAPQPVQTTLPLDTEPVALPPAPTTSLFKHLPA